MLSFLPYHLQVCILIFAKHNNNQARPQPYVPGLLRRLLGETHVALPWDRDWDQRRNRIFFTEYYRYIRIEVTGIFHEGALAADLKRSWPSFSNQNIYIYLFEFFLKFPSL